MDSNIKKALDRLDKADFSGYFTCMANVIMSDFNKNKKSDLRMTFISGDRTWQFTEQLKEFANHVAENKDYVVITDYKSAYYQLLVEHEKLKLELSQLKQQN